MKSTIGLFLGLSSATNPGALWVCDGFSVSSWNRNPVIEQTKGIFTFDQEVETATSELSRRNFVASLGLLPILSIPPSSAVADDDESMISTMFNADGSPKEGVEVEAKLRTVEFSWDVSENLIVNVDGNNVDGNASSGGGSKVRLSYELPLKWADGTGKDELYFDRSEGTNAKPCKRIAVFQAQGVSDMKRLEKATTIGVAKALGIPKILSRLETADIISGRTSKKNGQIYYEFDMAAAPETCGESAENLGLGFCPYDNIFLLSATVVGDRLYVMSVECEDTKLWKLASSELKRARSSFSVQAL